MSVTQYPLKAKLPPGLKAIGVPDGRGGIVVYYAETLNPDAAKDAISKARCAARHQGWLLRALMPAPLAAAVAQAVAHPRGTLTMLGAVAATGSLAGAAVILPPTSPATRLSPAGRVSVSAPAPHRGRRRADGTYYPYPHPQPVPQRAPAVLPHSGAAASPSPAPVSSVTGLLPPQESPSPAPSPTVCVTLLVLNGCVAA